MLVLHPTRVQLIKAILLVVIVPTLNRPWHLYLSLLSISRERDEARLMEWGYHTFSFLIGEEGKLRYNFLRRKTDKEKGGRRKLRKEK